jgi:hypothetical protein
MSLYGQGIANSFDQLGIQPVPVYSVAIDWFVNRTPLYSRFPQLPTGALSFKIDRTKYRPNTTTLATALTDTTGTSVNVADASIFMKGDVFEIGSEQFRITADPNTSANTVAVTRGYAGTTAATHLISVTVYLIGNARSSGETEQKGLVRLPNPITQYLQTFMHPVQVAGDAESDTSIALPPGVVSLMGKQRMLSMQEVADDFERSAYYGVGQAIASATGTQQQAGLRSILGTNNTTSPTNASAYKPSDFIRDGIQPCFDNGGHPDVILVSTDWMQGLEIWGSPAQRIDAGTTQFGLPIDTFEVPFLTGISLIPAPLLRPGTVITLTSAELRTRVKRAMFDKPRGSRGDAFESDVIAEMAIDPENEHHHAWVSGITGFSAS